MLTEGTRILNRLGSKASTSIVGGLMSDALAWSGQGSDAMAALDEALAVSANSGAAWLDAELHRRKAELMMSGGDLNATSAEGELIKAIDIARSQSAKLLELRASIGLARLLYGHRRRDEAHALLSPIYNWFTEGHTIPDLTEARLLLAEFAATPT
jgi:predicted ATPase